MERFIVAHFVEIESNVAGKSRPQVVLWQREYVAAAYWCLRGPERGQRGALVLSRFLLSFSVQFGSALPCHFP